MNKIILDGKEITPEQLPDGSVISGDYKNDTFYGIKEDDNIIFSNLFTEEDDNLMFCLLSNITIYRIPDRQKMWMATHSVEEHISTSGRTDLFWLKPKRGTVSLYWKGISFIDNVENNIGQKWEDEPWECWVKL